MATSTIAFGGSAFEARDSTMEIWLALLVDEIDKLPDCPDWLREVRDEWETMAIGHFGFGVEPDLDGVVTDAARRDLILRLASSALMRLESFGRTISAETLNGLRDWGKAVHYTRAVRAEHFLRPARYFIKLLEGRLAADETDARVDVDPA